MDGRRLTLRIPGRLLDELHQAAVKQAVLLNSLASQALESYVQARRQKRSRLSLRELSELLAPAAEADEIGEEERLRHARDVRRRIWQERHRRLVREQAAAGDAS